MQTFTRWIGRAGMLGFLLALCSPAWAQYTNATQDGTIDAANEYNNNVFAVPNGGSWYISWNGTTVYMAKTSITGNQPRFVYFDIDPVQPVTDASARLGGNALGNLNGPTDYGTVTQLPFRADARVIFFDGSLQVSRRDGGGNWGPSTNVGTFSANNNGIQEISFPWSALTGGDRPARFNWLAYQTNTQDGNGNFRFDLAPDNVAAAGSNNTTPPFEYYFTVLSTDNGYYPHNNGSSAPDRPTNMPSFSSRRNYTYTSFGALSVWDCTVDLPSQSLQRSSSNTGTDWNIGGTLTVASGTLNFGNSSGSGGTRTGNLYVTGSGTLNMQQTTNPLSVTSAIDQTNNNVRLTNGGTLILSGSVGGDLTLNGNFTLQDAATTFAPNNRTVTFNGTTVETITGLPSQSLAFDYLTVSSSSVVQLASNISVSQLLNFTSGNVRTTVPGNTSTAYVLDLLTSGSINGEAPASNVTGFVRSTRTVGAGGSGTVDFGNTGLFLTPNAGSDALGTTTVTRSRGVGFLTGQGTSQSINRNFRIVPATGTGSYDVQMQINYFDSEIPSSTTEGNLALFYSRDAVTFPTSGSGAFFRLPLSNLDQTTNIALRTSTTDFGGGSATGEVYTLGDNINPLPVQLVTFAGTRTAAGVQLNWLTAQEVQNAGFQVERQVAGGKWQAIQFLPGQGTGQGRAYSYLDAAAPAGLVYYRLRQVDTDGTGSYSPVVAVNGTARLGAPALALYPVPTPADQAQLTIDLSTLPAADRTLVLYDLQGRQLAQTTVAAIDATASLPVQGLAAGSYLVVVRGNGETYHARFNKL